jgi:hypothetical protein
MALIEGPTTGMVGAHIPDSQDKLGYRSPYMVNVRKLYVKPVGRLNLATG